MIGKRGLLSGCLLFVLAVSQPLVADITLTQANGQQLTLAAPANRIITLAPNLAELVFAAGAGEYLTAVVEYSDFPPAVDKLPKVGNAFRIDLEQIMALQPDLVIAWQSGNPQTALQKLTDLGITVWQLEIGHIEEIADTIDAIARAAGTESKGQAAATDLRSRLTMLKQQNSDKQTLRFFYQIASKPLYTVNGKHIISDSLEICGGYNIFTELLALAPQISREAVIVADPQVMIAASIEGQPPGLEQWQQWPRLQAVSKNALLYLPADEINRAGPRMLDSIELACKLLDQLRDTIYKE